MGEPLGVAVAEYPRERDRGKDQAKRVQQSRGDNEGNTCNSHRDTRGLHRNNPAWYFTVLGTGILRIKHAIGDPIESHCSKSRRGKRNCHEHTGTKRDRCNPRRREHTEQREWQREHGVWQLDERSVACNRGWTRERLPLRLSSLVSPTT